MLFKVGEVSKKIGMSIRALHHYDEIGLLSPLVGIISEKIGYIKTVQIGCLLLLMAGYLLFMLLQDSSIRSIVLAEFIFGIIIALISAPMFAVFIQNFPPQSRYTGVSLVYNLGMSIFASLTPLISITFFNTTGMQFLIGIVLSLSALGGLTSLGSICNIKWKSTALNGEIYDDRTIS